MAKHLASFALIGVSGRRVGTRFVFKFEDIPQGYPKPHFRWRNDECRTAYNRWAALAPSTGAQDSASQGEA